MKEDQAGVMFDEMTKFLIISTAPIVIEDCEEKQLPPIMILMTMEEYGDRVHQAFLRDCQLNMR
jgi:hypothetical protein